MDKLFLTPATFEKCAAYHILSKDSSQWVKEIITQFLEEHPFLQNEPMTVTWKKLDDVKGYAVGSLNTLGLTIPVIVKEWMLAPLDVIVFPGGKSLPLTQNILKEVLTEPQPFKGITKVKSKDNLTIFGDQLEDFQWSPIETGKDGATGEQGSTVREAVKVGSALDCISSVDIESVKNLFNIIKKDSQIQLGFEKNGTVGVLEKIAKMPKISTNTSVEDFVRGLEIDRQLVYKDSLGNTHVKQANSNIDYAWDTIVSPDELANYHSKTAELENITKESNSNVKLANSYELYGKKGHFYR